MSIEIIISIIISILAVLSLFVWRASIAYAVYRDACRRDDLHNLAMNEARTLANRVRGTDEVGPLHVIEEQASINCGEFKAKADLALEYRRLAGVKALQANRYLYASSQLPAGSKDGKDAYHAGMNAHAEAMKALAESKKLFKEVSDFMALADPLDGRDHKSAIRKLAKLLERRHGI